MKATAGSDVYRAIRNSYSLYAQPQLLAEWNYNRYVDAETYNVSPNYEEHHDVEAFPIESIIEANRPTKAGIVKARIGEARVSRDYADRPEAARYYIASGADKYKYWCSPEPSNNSGQYAMPNHTDGITTARPTVRYANGIAANKIVIGFENSWASPNQYVIAVDLVGNGTWTTIRTDGNAPINGDGQIILYRHESGWSTTVNYDEKQTIYGIQLRINGMNRPDSFANVIEISARLQQDITPWLVSVTDTFDLGDKSFITPLGSAVANLATITLSNIRFKWNNDNAESLYNGLIDENVKFNLRYGFDTSGQGGGMVWVNQFEMYSNSWNGQTEEQVTVECSDYAKFLMQEKPAPALYERQTIGEIVWRLCDSVGFNNYLVQARDDDPSTSVPVFWCDGSKTLWEIFSELALGTQAAIYFDGTGTLQIKTRRAVYDETRPVNWNLLAEPHSGDIPDIVSYLQTETFESNVVRVGYQTTKFSEWNGGTPKMEIVWEPEDTVVLRSAPLRKTLDKNDSFIKLDRRESRIWPYTGLVQIDGEIIRYDGKQYVWYTGGGPNRGRHETVVINSKEELRKYRDKTPNGLQRLNHFTGSLRIAERGMWNTENKRHPVEAEGYNVSSMRPHSGGGFTMQSNARGFRHHKEDSTVNLRTGRFWTPGGWLNANRGNSSDAGFYHYGFKIKFDKDSYKHQYAGMAFHLHGLQDMGYYIELTPTKTRTAKNRKFQQEVSFYSKKEDGVIKRIGGKKGTGESALIVADKWYEVDITYVVEGSTHRISIYLNGQYMFTANVEGSGDKHPWGGRFGMFARGDTNAFYEYLYAVANEQKIMPDNFTWYNKVYGGYVGSQWDREWVWDWRSKGRVNKNANKKDRERKAQRFFDEFGPYCHEVREFDIKFTKFPVLHSKLYFSNDWSAVCPEYVSDAFGARFILANASRENAVLQGEDSLSFIGGNSVNQRLTIIGRPVITRETEKVTVKDKESIRKRGRVETDISNPWIQTKEEAEALGKWIVKHWSKGNDEAVVNIFGNPLIELGDIVAIHYPEKDMTLATHRYVVVGATSTFDAGIDTTLTLRRIWA